MDRIDPTIPYYARQSSKQLETQDETGVIVREILRFLRKVNPSHMMSWNEEDTSDTIQLVKDQQYTMPMLSMAHRRLKSQAEKQKVDFNAFYQIIADIKTHWKNLNPVQNSYSNELDWREKERVLNAQHQERVVLAPKSGPSGIKAYWVKHIKDDLKKAGIKPNSVIGKIVNNL